MKLSLIYARAGRRLFERGIAGLIKFIQKNRIDTRRIYWQLSRQDVMELEQVHLGKKCASKLYLCLHILNVRFYTGLDQLIISIALL